MYVKRREVGIPWEEKDYTLRGLEEIVRNATQKDNSRDIRRQHTELVLNKQKSFGADTANPAERLREVSQQSSKSELVRALSRGKQDAIFANTSSSRLKSLRNMMKKSARKKN